MNDRKLKDPYPSASEWQSRKSFFTSEMGKALGDLGGVSTRHSRVLELELETVFCAGAWLATVVLACASAEVYVAGQDAKREAKFLEPYGLREEWIWLTNRRNQIVHATDKSPVDVSGRNYQQPDLEQDARRAVTAALSILLLGTRVQLETSLARDG